MAHVTKEIARASSRPTIKDDGSEDLLGGLLAKAVLFFGRDGRLLAAHCEIDRLRAWLNGMLHQPLTSFPPSVREILSEVLAAKKPIRQRKVAIPSSPSASSPEPGDDALAGEVFHVSANPTLEPGGALQGIVLALHDLSPVQELSQNLGQLVRLATIGTLAAGLAHEIKNALVAVNTFVELEVPKASTSELAPIVIREVRRIDNIVAQLLRVSNPKQAAFQPVRIHELLEHALAVAQHRMAGSRITVERKFEADPDLISGDSGQLEQAFVNLLFNAVEAMGSHGRLTVTSLMARLENQSPMLRITIEDTGSGIPEPVLRRLFEPFFTTKTTGHGLGLVITRRIILDHGGDIRVESKPGEGTTFTLDLPSSARQP